MFRCLIFFVAWLVLVWPAVAQERRAAFVVGNAVYDHAPDLENPGRDAALIAATLTDLGFAVTRVQDATRDELTRSFAEFLERSAEADVTLLYFAGHGMQFEGRNYLIGREARLETEFDIASETLPLDRMIEMMRRNSRAAMVFVDACRNNPLAEAFYTKTYSAARALSTRGLAPVGRGSDGAMVVFAASPGQVAYDGANGNSPFAAAMARHLPAPNMEVLSLMKRVIRDVKRDTGNRQVPMVTNDLTAEIFLGSDPVVKDPGPERLAALGDVTDAGPSPRQDQAAEIARPTPQRAVEHETAPSDVAQEWTWLEQRRADMEDRFAAAQAAGTVEAYARYLDVYPHGTRGAAAREAIDLIQASVLFFGSVGGLFYPEVVGRVRPQDALRAERTWGLEARDVKRVQLALNRRGFDAGPEDGVAGPRTRSAVAEFQASVGLAASGAISPLTARKLGVRYASIGAVTLSP